MRLATFALALLIGAAPSVLACSSTDTSGGTASDGARGGDGDGQGEAADAALATGAAAGVQTASPCVPPSPTSIVVHVAASNGSDSAVGSASAPVRTITKGLSLAQPGDTVLVHGGTYNELVTFPRSGLANKPITLRAACGEPRPLIDGTGKGAGVGFPALVAITDRSHLVVEGLALARLTGAGGNFPAGVWVRGAAKDIVLRNVLVREIKAEAGGADGGAHGIAIYGTNADPIEDVVVEASELQDLVLGASEALVVNGNVRRFTIRRTSVHDANNIAFDFIGYEGTCSGCSGDDLGAPSVDRARDGVVSGNVAYNITSRGNPAYGQDRSAGCFYVDGGGRITIERNTAHHCDIGVELASEHAGKATSEIIVRNNFLFTNWVTGISTGGYDAGNGPGGGRAEGCSVVHNTIVDSARDSWAKTALLLQNRNVNNVYANNILVASTGTSALKVDGAGNQGNAIDHNLYAGAVTGAQPGAGSISGQQPAFVSAATGDLHLQATSPAIGHGAVLAAAIAGTFDIDGDARGNDIGADQH